MSKSFKEHLIRNTAVAAPAGTNYSYLGQVNYADDIPYTKLTFSSVLAGDKASVRFIGKKTDGSPLDQTVDMVFANVTIQGKQYANVGQIDACKGCQLDAAAGSLTVTFNGTETIVITVAPF